MLFIGINIRGSSALRTPFRSFLLVSIEVPLLHYINHHRSPIKTSISLKNFPLTHETPGNTPIPSQTNQIHNKNCSPKLTFPPTIKPSYCQHPPSANFTYCNLLYTIINTPLNISSFRTQTPLLLTSHQSPLFPTILTIYFAHFLQMYLS
jgi:hypothetical protein